MFSNSLSTQIRIHYQPARLLHRSLALLDYHVSKKSSATRVQYSRDKLRNVGIIAHINAGKTTTTERILYHAGSTDSVGDVDKGNTVTDYLEQERNRGITITSAAVTYKWRNHQVNLIDTPGHVDFTYEVEKSLAAIDGAITIIDASAGVEAQTMTVWKQASKYKIPSIIFLNKFDKPSADHQMCLKDIQSSLGIKTAPIHLPVVRNDSFSSIIDVINRKHLLWSEPNQDHGSRYISEDIEQRGSPVDAMLSDKTEEFREKLINTLTDIDDQLADRVLDCDSISKVSGESITEALRRATLSCDVCPVLVGSSFKYIGVQQLMDAANDFLPSPIDHENHILRLMNHAKGKLPDKSKMSAFIFKIMHDGRLGALSYLRVCSGALTKGHKIRNLELGSIEQVKRVYHPFADELRELDSAAEKDDIVVAVGLTQSRTGDLIVDQSFSAEKGDPSGDLSAAGARSTAELPFQLLNQSIIVPRIETIEPVYFCCIESRSSGQQLKLEHALACLCREDPSFSFGIDQRGVMTVRGMGKLHLEVIRDRIKSEYGLEPLLGPLQISYRETIEGSAVEELAINRKINSVNNTMMLRLRISPKPKAGPWHGKQLRIDTSGENSLGKLRHDQRKALEIGFASALMHGPSLGYPVIDSEVLLLDFSANSRCGLPIISSAASQCLSAAIKRSQPKVLEPIMLLEVVAPKNHNSTLLGDLQSTRRALLLSAQGKDNGTIVIRCEAPLSTLADYSEFLRTTTSGRGTFSMELSKYKTMSETDLQSVVRL